MNIILHLVRLVGFIAFKIGTNSPFTIVCLCYRQRQFVQRPNRWKKKKTFATLSTWKKVFCFWELFNWIFTCSAQIFLCLDHFIHSQQRRFMRYSNVYTFDSGIFACFSIYEWQNPVIANEKQNKLKFSCALSEHALIQHLLLSELSEFCFICFYFE